MNKKRLGFTLVEVLVTVSIIAILTSVGLATYTGAQKRSRDARRMADLEAVRSALELYRADNPTVGYPTTAGLNDYERYDNLASVASFNTYISTLPNDPTDSGAYQYQYGKDGFDYYLCATREILIPVNYCLAPP